MRACGEKPTQASEDTGRMPTKALWDRIPWTSIVDGEREGHVTFEDFINFPVFAAADAVDTVYGSFADAGTTIQQGADNEYGSLEIVLDATDEDEGWVFTGGGVGGSYEFIKQATAAPHIIAFEARFKKSVVTSGCHFIGMGEPGVGASSGMVDTTGAMVDKNWIGFHTLEAAPANLSFSFKADGQTVQNHIAALDTLVLDTYVKAGFLYDYRGPNAKQVSVWLNGQLQSTYVTKANFDAATFPWGEELALHYGLKATTAVACTGTVDWWKAAMVPTG